MTIACDVRLFHQTWGGVVEYTKHLLVALVALESEHDFVFFYNSRTDIRVTLPSSPRCTFVSFSYPSSVLDISLLLTGRPYLDECIEQKIGKRIDIFFAPNIDFLALSPRCRSVVTVHDLTFDMYPELLSLRSRLWHAFIRPRVLMSKVNHLIAVSESTRQDLIMRYAVNPAKISVTHLGVGEEFFQETSSTPIIDGLYILAYGLHEPRKNILHLIRAFAKSIREEPVLEKWKLVIAGEVGRFGSEARHLIRLLGIEERVILYGYVPEEKRVVLMRHAGIFVYPSFYEGFGLPLVEAMAAGVPIISSLSSSMGEILGSAGLLVDPYNGEDLVIALCALACDESLRQRFSVLGRVRAREFTWDRTARKTLKIFESLNAERVCV